MSWLEVPAMFEELFSCTVPRCSSLGDCDGAGEEQRSLSPGATVTLGWEAQNLVAAAQQKTITQLS